MKIFRNLTLVLVPLAMLWVAWADDPHVDPGGGEASPMIGFFFEWIEVDHRTANKLVRKHITSEISADALRAELEEMLDSEKAKLVETAYLTTRQGIRTQSESVEELHYPTEFDPAEIPQTFKVSGTIANYPTSPAHPTAFDVRNVGTTVELEATATGDVIDLSVAHSIVRFLGSSYIGEKETPHKLLAAVKQPEFYVMRANSRLRLKSGHFTLLNVFKPHGDKGKRVLLLVHAKTVN